jgi:hypothetical protein
LEHLHALPQKHDTQSAITAVEISQSKTLIHRLLLDACSSFKSKGRIAVNNDDGHLKTGVFIRQ